jgi:hypothetical protein
LSMTLGAREVILADRTLQARTGHDGLGDIVLTPGEAFRLAKLLISLVADPQVMELAATETVAYERARLAAITPGASVRDCIV